MTRSSLDEASLMAQLGSAYERFTQQERSLHVDLIRRATADPPVATHTVDRGAGLWTLTVVARDAIGTLAAISGTLTAAGFDIERASIYTARSDTDAKFVLDMFDLHGKAGWTAAHWSGWEKELVSLLQAVGVSEADDARSRLVERVADVLRDAGTSEERLWPVTIEPLAGTDVALRIRGQDTPGFLFSLANAFAILDINITRAEIQTTAGESDDVLWVADPHGAHTADPGRIARLRAAVALIKQFTLLLPHAPDPAQALREFGALTRQLLASPDWDRSLPALASPGVQRTLADLLGTSAFLWDDFLRMQYANLFPVVGDPTPEDRRDKHALQAELEASLAQTPGIEARKRALNAFKDREMFRIDLRYIRSQVDFRGFAEQLSELADVVVSATGEIVVETLGPPPCAWAICALGKCGGREMGFASDVELLFVYAEDDPAGSETNARYFEAFVRTFLATLETQREGIFEVDLRLRPHGNAGPLASSLAGLSAYYNANGAARQFERLALVKLRPVAGDSAVGARATSVRDAYVYADVALDWDEIRHLRRRQAAELVQPGVLNAKYSAGGLVDIEYWVQARQIEVGAHDRSVRVPSTLLGIERLHAGGHVSDPLAKQLAAAYAYLRRLIDGLRVVRGNARDLAVPPHDSRAFDYLARRLDADPGTLSTELHRHMDFAQSLWHAAPERGVA